MAAKILLVEDDNNLREIYEARLQAEGYTIVTATDGEQALVVAKAETPALIISDVMMPRISGFEMLDILRNTDTLKDTKVIMLTALGQADDKTRANSLGADRYLVKSQVTLEDIVKAAHELLEGAATAPAPATPAATPTAPATPPATPATPAPAPVMPPVTAPIASPPVPEPPVATPVVPAPVIAPAEPAVAAPTSPAFNPTLGSQPEPLAAGPVIPAAGLTPAPATDPMTPPTVSEEKATVGAQIDSFVNSPAPEPVAPTQAQQDDAVLADAMHELASDAEEKPESTPAPATNEPDMPAEPASVAPEPFVPAAPAEPAAPLTPSTPMDPPAAPTAINDNVPIANKKMIQPLSGSGPKPGIHELLAREEANAGAPTTSDTPPAPSTTFSPTGMSAPAAPDMPAVPLPAQPAPAPIPSENDPNNIAL